jgi:hypothetical protein
MLKRVLITVAAAMLSLASVHAPAIAAEPAKAQASAEVKKDLKKLMEAYGNGEMSAKEYKARKEALMKGQPKA